MALNFFVNINKVPNPRFEVQPRTCTFVGCLRVHWRSVMMEVDSINSASCPKGSFIGENYIIPMAIDIFTQVFPFPSVFFSGSRGFFIVVPVFKFRARRWLRIISQDIFICFFFNFACLSRNNNRVLLENISVICLSCVSVVFTVNHVPWGHRRFYLYTPHKHLFTNVFHFFKYLSSLNYTYNHLYTYI